MRTIGRGFPDVDEGILDWLSSLGVCHGTRHVCNLSILWRIKGNGGTEFSDRRICPPEGAKNSA